MSKKSSFDPTFFVMMIIALIFVFGAPTAITSATGPTYTTNVKTFNYKDYADSVSDVAMCNLASEVYIGFIGNLMSGFMDIKQDEVSGWEKIDKGSTDAGFEWAFWVNKYDNKTFCMAFAGTDQFRDTLQYLSMELNESRAKQMDEAIETTKKIPTMLEEYDGYEGVDKMYITGHSLGGYLAMYVASEIVDADAGSEMANVSKEDLCIENLSQMKCLTYGAPGMYQSGTFINLPLTSWEEYKKVNNENKVYDKVIRNYVNDLDPVGVLLPEHLFHLGSKIMMRVSRSPVSTILRFCKLGGDLAFYAVGLGPALWYHMPWVYITNIRSII